MGNGDSMAPMNLSNGGLNSDSDTVLLKECLRRIGKILRFDRLSP